MHIAVVTSCSRAGFEKYGLRCLTTLNQFWPIDIDVYLVSEDAIEIPVELMVGRKFKFINLSESQQAVNFYKDHDTPRSRGLIRTHQGFRFDAWKFSKKVFAIELVAARVSAHRLIWLDADVVTFASVPAGFFDTLPPHAYAVACLERTGYHSECGFVGYNLTHAASRKFITEFAQLYVSGDVFRLKEWHDSFVFDWLRKQQSTPTYKIPHRSQSHPFVHSVLGKFMDHLKGVHRKDRGQSHDHPRLEAARALHVRKPIIKPIRVSMVKLNRRPIGRLSKLSGLAARRAIAKQRAKEKKAEARNAMRNGDMVAGRGHPLSTDAEKVTIDRQQGDLSTDKADGGAGRDSMGSTECSS